MRQLFSNLSFALLILFIFPMATSSQDPDHAEQQVYFGFDSTSWNKISNRYERSQARAEIQTKDGTEINGQIVQIDAGKMIVYPGYEVIIDPRLSNEFIKIDLNEISRIKVKRNTKNYEAMIMAGTVGGFTGLVGGGILLWTSANLLTVSPFLAGGAAAGGFLGRYLQQFPRRYNFENENRDQDETFDALKAWAIFEDTIHYYTDFRDLVDHSALVARSFPVKRLRVTAAIGPVLKGYGFSSTVAEVMPPEYPMFTYDGRGFSPGISLGAAYRIGNKFHVGAAWFNSNIFGAFRYDLADTLYYEFSPRKIKGYKIFSEYSLVSPDRYLTNRIEVTGGAGMAFARTEQFVRWQVHKNFTDFYDYGEMDFRETKIRGVLGHVLVNYYLSPNTSLSAGVEGNLFQSLTIPALDELEVEYETPLDFQVPEYKVNYSSIHMKFGINFHL